MRPPVALRIWFDVARPGDLQFPDLPQVQCLVIDAPDITACIYDQLHLAGHMAPPTPPRLRMFRRGLSTRSSLTLA